MSQQLKVIAIFHYFGASTGASHAVGEAEEAETGRSQHCRDLARHRQCLRGSPRRPRGFQAVRLRLLPSGRLWRAHYLRKKHEALLLGPRQFCLQAQLQLDRNAAQEEKQSHSTEHVWRVQPGAQ